MNVSWFWLIFIATNLFSVSDLIDKFLCAKKFKNTYAFAVSTFLLSIVFIIGLSFFVNWSHLYGWPFFLALASGPLYFLMWILLWKALVSNEASRAIAVFNTMPIFNALLAAFFLNEVISGSKWLAIILIAIGAVICAWENKADAKFNRAYLLVILSAFVAAVANIISKFAASQIDALTLYPISFLGSLPFYGLFLLKKEVLEEVKVNLRKKKVLAVLFIRTLVTFMAVCFFYLALAKGPASLVLAVNGIGPLFVLIYAVIASLFLPKYIKEELDSSTLLQKSLAIILIVSGVILINR